MSLKHAVLALLEAEEGSGYDLMKRFQARLGYFWNASHQQIYQQLKKMHSEQLISLAVETQSDKPDRKVYSITPKGCRDLQQWLAEPVKPNKINDALLVKLYAGELAEPASLQAEIARHRTIHRQTLNTFLGIEREYHASPSAEQRTLQLPFLTLRRGILGEQAWLAWADEVDAVLAQRQP
ncbi:PadR family transcriptional regulator [Aestuariicella hydrocarbonica]|uniref:PadR family transcriptional regulator n=1 Tax=Pseudomaricurvus hydrocarbonicus TaxID=1470433 RepID=A0A9E5T283_9GAMM|nr:PadR family transcriptional regulator [Aestuariicella hydrocarbonica]